jgi:hypothetical protein
MSAPPIARGSFARWLAETHAACGPRVAQALHGLPGRAVYSGRAAPRNADEEAFVATEFSVREGSSSLRLAYALDRGRGGPDVLAHALERLGTAAPQPLATWTGTSQVGIDAGAGEPRTKVYVYADEGRYEALDTVVREVASEIGALEPVEARMRAAPLAFAAFDLRGGRCTAIKLYNECDTRDEAALVLAPFGNSALRLVLMALPEPVAATLVPFVVTARYDATGLADVTLHAWSGYRIPLVRLVEIDLSQRVEALAARATRVGLRWQGTYVSWTVSPQARFRTVYGQLRPPSDP